MRHAVQHSEVRADSSHRCGPGVQKSYSTPATFQIDTETDRLVERSCGCRNQSLATWNVWSFCFPLRISP